MICLQVFKETLAGNVYRTCDGNSTKVTTLEIISNNIQRSITYEIIINT